MEHEKVIKYPEELKTMSITLNDDDSFEMEINGKPVTSELMMSLTNIRRVARVFTRIAVSLWYDIDMEFDKLREKQKEDKEDE